MPNVVLTTNKSIYDIQIEDMFFDGKSAFLYPIELDRESFFIRIYQNADKVIVKLEKSTMPKITNKLKASIMEFALNLEKLLDGKILHHNLNPSRPADYNLYDKYEITTSQINNCEYINSLCRYSDVSFEIGMGSGEFLTDLAIKNKSECFVGSEILNNDFGISLRRFDAAGLTNIKAIRYDARAILDRFRPNSLKNVYLNFPEPWFKYRKIKHSILTPKTAKTIERIIRLSGKFTILTDNRPFAVSAATIVENSTNLKKTNSHSINITDENIKTKYEKKWIKYKRTIYKLQYEKIIETSFEIEKKTDFLRKMPRQSIVKNGYVVKILNIYSNIWQNKKIAELAVGYATNPQHIFFGLKDDYTLKVLPQSNFIINSDFQRAMELALF